MAVLKFRIYLEEDDSIYRDIAIKHTQNFVDLHEAILAAYGFDKKHKATFFRSNDFWQKGKKITLEFYENENSSSCQLMQDSIVGNKIKEPNQKFIYLYDFNKNWTFLVELISVSKEENIKLSYPALVRVEGIAPSQYGLKSILGERFAEVEEKYDLNKDSDGYGEEGDENETETETSDDVIVNEENEEEG